MLNFIEKILREQEKNCILGLSKYYTLKNKKNDTFWKEFLTFNSIKYYSQIIIGFEPFQFNVIDIEINIRWLVTFP